MSGNAGLLIIYVVAFIAIFYFMAIRPQQRQRRAHQTLLSTLKKGDRIVTAAGIYGTVKRVEENIVVVEIAKGVTIKIARRAVAEIIRDSAQARATAPEGLERRAKGSSSEPEDTNDDEADAATDEAGGEAEVEDTADRAPAKVGPKSSSRRRS